MSNPLMETAQDWWRRSSKQNVMARDSFPATPVEAANAFFRPGRTNAINTTGIRFVDAALEHAEKTRNDSHVLMELSGPSGSGKTWTLVTLAAKFLAATRPSLFPARPEKSPKRSNATRTPAVVLPQVIILDSADSVHMTNLRRAVLAAILLHKPTHEDNYRNDDRLYEEVCACLKRIHVVRLGGASAVPSLELIRCSLVGFEECPALVLWDDFGAQIMDDEVSRAECIRQLTRLLKRRNVFLAITTTMTTRSLDSSLSSSDKLVTCRIQLETPSNNNNNSKTNENNERDGFVANITGQQQHEPVTFRIGSAGILS